MFYTTYTSNMTQRSPEENIDSYDLSCTILYTTYTHNLTQRSPEENIDSYDHERELVIKKRRKA